MKLNANSQNTKQHSALYRWALDFVRKEGVMVLPIDADKAPKCKNYSFVSQGSEVFSEWFDKEDARESGIGLACGFVNKIVAIDCDVTKDANGNPVPGGARGEDQFKRLCRLNGSEPSHVCQTTPSGGIHYFYKWRDGFKNKVRLRDAENNELLIDARSDNGYVAVAMIHEDLNEFKAGKTDITRAIKNGYQRIADENGEIPPLCDAPEMPDWLYELFRAQRIKIDEERTIAAAMRRIAESRYGSRNQTLNNICYQLGRFFYDREELLADIKNLATQTALECGLSEKEVNGTVKSGITAGVEKAKATGDRGDIWYAEVEDQEKECREESRSAQKTENPYASIIPPLPYSALSKKVRYIIDEAVKGFRITREMAFAALIGLASACIGRSRGVVYSENTKWTEYANLYMMIIAETGDGKSPTVGHFFQYLLDVEKIYKKAWKRTRQAYEKAMASWSREDGERPDPPVNHQFILDDATMEAAIERLDDNPRGLFWNIDELNSWFDRIDRYNKHGAGEGKNKLISSWDSRQISYARKTNQGAANEFYISGATMGIIGGIQPGLVKDLFKPNDIKQGLPQRFMYVRSRRIEPRRFPFDKMEGPVESLIKVLTENLVFGLEMDESLTDRRKGKKITFDKGAIATLNNWLNATEQKYFGDDFYPYTIKMSKMIMRLALILHYIEWGLSFRKDYQIFGTTDNVNIEIIHETKNYVPQNAAAKKDAAREEGEEGEKGEKPKKGGKKAGKEQMKAERDGERASQIKEYIEPSEPLPGSAWKELDNIEIPEGCEDIFDIPYTESCAEEGQITFDTVMRACELMRWLKANSYWIYQILPKDMGGLGKKDVRTILYLVARMLASKKKEIIASNHFVKNAVFKEWLKEVPGNSKAIKDALKQLNVDSDRDGKSRGRRITIETIETCEQILREEDSDGE